MATSNFVAPNQFRQLRACMVCSVVQTGAVRSPLPTSSHFPWCRPSRANTSFPSQRFLADGCPNCDFLDLKGLSERVQDCTSQVYEGLLTVADPERSWVARWQRLDKYKPGVYAVKVVGTLPDEVLQDIEDAGVRYVPRDGSAQDDEQ